MVTEYASLEEEEDVSDSGDTKIDVKVYEHVTLAEVQSAFDAGRTADACDMLEQGAPHLAIAALMKVSRLSDGQGMLHQLSSDGHHDQLSSVLALVRALQRNANNPSMDSDVVTAINRQDARGRTALHWYARAL